MTTLENRTPMGAGAVVRLDGALGKAVYDYLKEQGVPCLEPGAPSAERCCIKLDYIDGQGSRTDCENPDVAKVAKAAFAILERRMRLRSDYHLDGATYYVVRKSGQWLLDPLSGGSELSLNGDVEDMDARVLRVLNGECLKSPPRKKVA